MQSFCRLVDGWSECSDASDSFGRALCFLQSVHFSVGSHPVLGFFFCFESCRAGSEEACSRWRRPSWVIAFLPRSEGWPLLCTELRSSVLRPSVRRWVAGSPTATPGAGFSILTFPMSLWHSYWLISLSRIHLTLLA